MSVVASQELATNSPDLEPRAYARTMRRILVLLIAVGVGIRLVRLIIPSPIWGDEAMLALNFVDRDYVGLTKCLENAQVAPILFLWIERLVLTNLGSSDWLMRLVPFLAAVGGQLAFWDFARRSVSPTAATLAVGIMAVSVWPVSMAATLKPYSCDLFWSALLLALAARWHQRPERLRPLMVLAALVPLALASSYPTVFVAGGITIYLLPAMWRARRQAQALFVLYNVGMLATFATTYFLVAQPQVDPSVSDTGSYMRWYWRNGFLPDSAWQWPLWFLKVNTGRMFAYPLGDADGGSSATTILFLIGCWWCWRNGSRPLLVACIVPFVLNFIAAVLGKYPYAGCCRLSQHVAPAICLLAGVGWATIMERVAPKRQDRLKLVLWATGFLIVFGTGELIHRCVKISNGPVCQFSKSLHRELQIVVQPGDLIVVHNLSTCDVTTQWYLKRFGHQLIIHQPGQALPQADRLWVVSMLPRQPAAEWHRDFISAAKDWRAGDTASYAIRWAFDDEPAKKLWWYTCVTCLQHQDDSRPFPQLNVVP
jgi:hypothetical protein